MTKPVHALATARGTALHILLECQQKDAFVQEILDQHLSRAALSANDRALTTQLVYGVLRRRGTLDALLRPLVKRPPHQVESWLWDALRLGAYQLLLLTQIPAYAALNETVELATLQGKPRGKGFLNGVLRALLSLVTPDFVDAAAADALPLEQGRYRRLSQAALPSPAAHPVEYLSSAFALPRWLVERWHKRFGWQRCLELGFWFASPAPLWLRVNPLKVDRPTFLAALAEAGIAAEPGPHPQSVRLAQSLPIRDLPHYAAGWFTVQDVSAMGVASALAPQPGSRVLDLCAAPGGKTSHLAELMNNQGQILACDVDEERLRSVTTLCQRLGMTTVETHRLESTTNPELPVGPFDAALVDVPCSNTGVLGRRPEVRWRLRSADLKHLVTLQTKLLLLSMERVRPGGVVVYSTCSIEPEENGQLVRTVLGAMRDWHLETEQNSLPGQPGDGGYWACLQRQLNSSSLNLMADFNWRPSMTTPAPVTDNRTLQGLPTIAGPLPLLNEAEEEDLGSADPHYWTSNILAVGIISHLASQPQYRVFADLNFYIHPGPPTRSATPDVMVVIPSRDLGENVSSYHLGTDGPAPLLVVEVLSESTAQQRDLGDKIQMYSQLGIAEYILVDRWGQWLPQRLLLKRLQTNGIYQDVPQDPDGGISSNLGFRFLVEADRQLGVFDAKTGRRYARPTQAQQEAEARRQAEEKQRLAEEKQRQDAEARRQAEEKQRQAEEKQRQAEEKQRQDAEARHQAEEKQRQAEEKQRQDAEARRQAEEKQRLAEEKLQILQAEIQRLRPAAEQPPAQDETNQIP